jgi:hypothetical protein
MSGLSGTRQAPLVVLRDERASGTNGGSSVAGSWLTRTLNVEATDTNGICSLASSEFTLPPGRYVVSASARFYASGATSIRLWNVTGAAALIVGDVARCAPGADAADAPALVGVFDLAATSTLRLEYRASNAQATTGLGAAWSFGTEVYAQVTLQKVR